MVILYKVLQVLEFLWVAVALIGVHGYGNVAALTSLPALVFVRQYLLSWINLRMARAGDGEYSEFLLSASRKFFAEISDILADLIAFACFVAFALQIALNNTNTPVPAVINVVFLLLPLPLSVRYVLLAVERIARHRTKI